MDDKSYLNEVRNSLKEAVDFFSATQDKFIRERWVVAEFLTNLSIPFSEADLVRGTDPPDVVFHEANFEVKEIMDKERKRHAEYKHALASVKATTNPADLLRDYSPIDISIREVFARIYSMADDLACRKYPLDVRRQLDLLCYVNLQDVMGFVETPFPDVAPLKKLGYRSISFLDADRSCILCADPSAPIFLHAPLRVIRRSIP